MAEMVDEQNNEENYLYNCIFMTLWNFFLEISAESTFFKMLSVGLTTSSKFYYLIIS